MSNLRTAAEQALDALTNCSSEHGHRCNRCDSEVDEGGRVADALRAALAAEQPQPEADERADDEALRREMADILTRTATALRGPPGPREAWGWADLPERAEAAIAAITTMTLAAKHAAAPPPAAPCPHIRSSGTGELATNRCALNGPPAAPEPSEAEVAAAMASLHRDMEPAAWPSEDEVTDALRAAAAARKA